MELGAVGERNILQDCRDLEWLVLAMHTITDMSRILALWYRYMVRGTDGGHTCMQMDGTAA